MLSLTSFNDSMRGRKEGRGGREGRKSGIGPGWLILSSGVSSTLLPSKKERKEEGKKGERLHFHPIGLEVFFNGINRLRTPEEERENRGKEKKKGGSERGTPSFVQLIG